MMKGTKKSNLTKNILLALVMGASAWYNIPMGTASGVIANNTLPSNPQEIIGGIHTSIKDNSMNITQSQENAIIKWEDFSIGANASVNFERNNGGKFNTLNYVNSGKLSQIYGTINAREGNIYLVNTAGVQISNSAQINVGSLYVSNKNLDTPLKSVNQNTNINDILNRGTTSLNADLMSLGNINANKVTFDGGRIILDTDRIKSLDKNENISPNNITVKTTNKEDVVLGYTAYDSNNNTYEGQNNDDKLANLIINNGLSQDITKKDGYMWVANLEQLQNIQTNTGGNFALRNNIDASSTAEMGQRFNSITGFKGNFEGLNNNIFDLNINSNADNVGLFADITGTTIRDINIIAGSISGNGNVGSIVGIATDSTIENITNTATVNGVNQVGGIVGSANNTVINNVKNTGSIAGKINVGGVVGHISNQSKIIGNTGNLASVKGDYNVGGIVGSAINSTIGNEDEKEQVYNKLEITGNYNIGGIAGNIQDGTIIQNVVNEGNIMAEGNTTDDYKYTTADTSNINAGTIDNIEKIQYYEDGYHVDGNVLVSNVGGIVGVSGNSKDNNSKNQIKNATNKGDISTAQDVASDGENTYIGGNVGGIIGKSVNTDIDFGENIESNIHGAHNVGGIAGYFENGTVSNSLNNGGDILASGAIVKDADGTLKFLTSSVRNGDAGGKESEGVGNVGGIVGYLFGNNSYINKSGNRGNVHTAIIGENTDIGKIRTTSNVGGVVGRIDRTNTISMDEIKGNGKLAVNNSYNTGSVSGYKAVGGIAGFMYNGEVANSYNLGKITSTRQRAIGTESLNLGGVVGDTTEGTNSVVNIYNVYNKGQIGDENYEYYGRHVGGVVGRLSGNVENSYNSGTIYNGYSVVGGIAGWWVRGSINNSYNTANITVVNHDTELFSSVGGIIGGAGTWDEGTTLNLSNVYNLGTIRSFQQQGAAGNRAGLIIGELHNYSDKNPMIQIKNVYTLGNIYVDGNTNQNVSILGVDGTQNGHDFSKTASGIFYIKPKKDGVFLQPEDINESGITSINYEDRDKESSYGDWIKNGQWRIYEGTTPILNAFMPKASDYLEKNKGQIDGIINIQYGTAYNPLLTIINVDRDIVLDWNSLNTSNQGSLAIYGGGLTLNNFINKDNDGFFAGSIFTEGSLNINSDTNSDMKIGSGASLIGSTINIDTGSKDLIVYGDIIATGNDKLDSEISLNGDDVITYGKLQTVTGDTAINGISEKVSDINYSLDVVNDYTKDVADLGEAYGYTVSSDKNAGNISINAQSNVGLYYGNEKVGFVSSGNNLEIVSGGDTFIDCDLKVGKDIKIISPDEILIDVSNIGKVQNPSNTVQTMQNFLSQFNRDNGSSDFIFNSGKSDITPDIKFTIDLWDDDNHEFNLNKYGSWIDNLKAIAKLDININKQQIEDNYGVNYVYIWIDSAEQLNAIDKVFQETSTSDRGITTFNLALKNDINMNDIEDFNTIGSGNVKYDYNSIFDGRGNNILGLRNKDGGLFDSVGRYGVVKDINIISSVVTSNGENTGVIANKNEGAISNITGLGNSVKGSGTVGGIVGQNIVTGTIINVSDSSVVATTGNGAVGGIVGINGNMATVSDSYSASAVTNSSNEISEMGIGGIVGSNLGTIDKVSASGVTSGLYKYKNGEIVRESNNIGGIVGINKGTLSNAYNESIVSGKNFVGGIVGSNEGEITNIANATSVTSDNKKSDEDKASYIGGIAGSNSGSIKNGRNNGIINGIYYVGGLVGINREKSTLTNLINDSSAIITGKDYIGGIAGANSGNITIDNQDLVNNGEIRGSNYVGGIVGKNEETGIIGTVRNDINLIANSDAANYFGGIVGYNAGRINDATNNGNITAYGSTYVGGIAGYNEGLLEKAGNSGIVIGKDLVGGVVGKNESDMGFSNLTIINTNSGKIISSGGAGGIFGENTADITNAVLVNNGEVYGNINSEYNSYNDHISGTGGIFGVNSGNIISSSLINNIDAVVSGTLNVGGLIGVNTGIISGGRDENNSYYKYQIYNNGKIVGETGINVGGLVGWNTILDGKTGSVTGAYNTGHISITNGENIGGIVGTNDGNIDQVFNTAYQKISDGNDGYKIVAGYINGKTNVGGLIGNNTGSITNSYNMANVSNNAGNAIGNNQGIATNIYATNITGKLVSSGNKAMHSYSFVNGDTSVDNILLSSEQQKNEDSYNDFTNKNDDDIWKFYDGYQTPLLKIFLTKVTTDGSENDQNLIYNGKDQKLDIGNLTGEGGAWSAHDNFEANNNAEGSLINHGSQISIDAGEYTDDWWSQQIGIGVDSVNNLGYDLESTKYRINKKKLEAIANDIERKYGNIYAENGYGFNIIGWVEGEEDLINNIILGDITDGGLTGNSSGRVTNDVGNYIWSGNLDASALKNYDFGGTTFTQITGKSIVSKATININANNTDIYKGQQYPNYNGIISGIVNGDSIDNVFGSNWEWGNIKPETESNVGNHKDVITIKVGDKYYSTADQMDLSALLKNYDVQITPGTLIVRDLSIVVPGGYDYLYKDGWDRNRDYRDRKAEINFVNGGVLIN